MKRAFVIACALLFAGAANAQEQTAPPAQQQPAAQPQQLGIVQQQMLDLGEFCGVMKNTDATHTSYIPIPGYTILHSTPPFSAPPGALDAVVCDRPTLFIGVNDHRVLTDLGVPLFIRNAGRVMILEVAEGRFRVRFIEGRPTSEESQTIAAAIDRAHADTLVRTQH